MWKGRTRVTGNVQHATRRVHITCGSRDIFNLYKYTNKYIPANIIAEKFKQNYRQLFVIICQHRT